MEGRVVDFVRTSLDTRQVVVEAQLQALWGGQGFLFRVSTDLPGRESVIVKCIALRSDTSHPRGWNTSRSFLRKARSYEVECLWYEHFAQRCTKACKVPQLLGIQRDEQVSLILLEDLAIEYPVLRERLNVQEVEVCLRWLAEFHAEFLHDAGEGLWPQGCYWHLQTRPDEWEAMTDSPIKEAASWLDERLRTARFLTLVHGDAKVANFCFSQDMISVSAVDFQYVGRGCGMSDVIYLLGSCLSEKACREHEQALLDCYFSHLGDCMARHLENKMTGPDRADKTRTDDIVRALDTEWRSLFAVAWADFHRFLLGWMPEHTKINPYTEAMVVRALADRSKIPT